MYRGLQMTNGLEDKEKPNEKKRPKDKINASRVQSQREACNETGPRKPLFHCINNEIPKKNTMDLITGLI